MILIVNISLSFCLVVFLGIPSHCVEYSVMASSSIFMLPFFSGLGTLFAAADILRSGGLPDSARTSAFEGDRALELMPFKKARISLRGDYTNVHTTMGLSEIDEQLL